MHSESEPWQPTTSSAIGLPNPSPPLPPPFLTSATYLCDARGNIIGKPGIPCDAYTNSNRTTIGAPPSPGVKTEVKRYRRVLRSPQQPLAARTHHPPQELLPTLLSPTSAPHPRRHPTKRNRRALQKLHAAAKLLRCSVEYEEEDYRDFCASEGLTPIILDSVEKHWRFHESDPFWETLLHRHDTGQRPLYAIEYMDANRVWHLSTDYPPNNESPLPPWMSGCGFRSYTEAYYPKYYAQQTALGFDFPPLPTSAQPAYATSSEYHSAVLDRFFGSGKHALQQFNALVMHHQTWTPHHPTTSAKDDTELLSLETHLESASFEQASAGLPIHCDSSNRVLPTPGDAIPSNGLPPRPPPGQFRSRSPDRTTPFLATNHPANTPDSPESPRFILRESPPDQPVAVEEAPVFEGAAG